MVIELSDTLPDSLRSEDVQWIRPFQLVKNPKFFSDYTLQESFIQRHEVIKGLNGGFFLAAVAGLTRYPERFVRVVLRGQDFGDSYNGKFRFRFFGEEGSEPREVEVDDRLPTIDGKLVFAQAPGDVFWCPLLEKAYAKFRGGYEQLNLGQMYETLVHLTGQKTCTLLTANIRPEELFTQLMGFVTEKQILCCKHKHSDGNDGGHGGSYTITDLRDTNGYEIMIRSAAEDEEEWISFGDFRNTYDIVFATDGESATERQMARNVLENTMTMRGGPFDDNGRYICASSAWDSLTPRQLATRHFATPTTRNFRIFRNPNNWQPYPGN